MDFAVKDLMVVVLPDHASAVCDDAANTSCKATDPPSALALTRGATLSPLANGGAPRFLGLGRGQLDVRAAVGAPASAK